MTEIHSVQIPPEIYKNLINHLSTHAATDSWAKQCLEELTEKASEIKKCSRCVEPATELTDSGNYYCHKHWMEACTEGEPSLKQEQQLMEQRRRMNRYL